MNTGIVIVAHSPLATALRECVLHVYPDAAEGVAAVDIQPDEASILGQSRLRDAIRVLNAQETLVLADVFGASPCNMAQRVVDGVHSRLVAGVNLPMLLRTINYRQEPLDMLVARAVTGGMQCILQVAVTAPLNQKRKTHDPIRRDHHQ